LVVFRLYTHPTQTPAQSAGVCGDRVTTQLLQQLHNIAKSHSHHKE
jgi:hypothetical protein